MNLLSLTMGYDVSQSTGKARFYLRNGPQLTGSEGQSFDDTPVGRNQFMTAVMKQLMDWQSTIDAAQDHRTEYHRDILSGVAKPTNREDYFRQPMRDSASGRPPASHADNAGSIPAFRTADV